MDELRRAGARHHDTDTLDPAVAADLDALDAALAGDARDAEWAALVAAVREEPPALQPGFARTLDAKVADGFHREGPSWPRLPGLLGRPRLAVACVAVLCLLIAGVASLPGGSSDDDTSSSAGAVASSSSSSTAETTTASPSAAASAAKDSADAATSTDAIDPAAPVPVPPAVVSPTVPVPGRAIAPFSGRAGRLGGARKVERSTDLALRTSARKLQSAADGVVRATQDVGGVVETSQVDTSPTGGTASFVLRVPTARLDDALKRFGELASVQRLSQGAQDITGTFVSAQDRLSDARAERKALLAALGKATTPRAIASLRARIAGNRTTIARLEGDLRGLRRRTDTARVTVTLNGSGAAPATDDGGAWGPRDAARDALRVLEVLAGVALVGGAVLAPLALLGAGAALGGRAARRRRREAALTAS